MNSLSKTALIIFFISSTLILVNCSKDEASKDSGVDHSKHNAEAKKEKPKYISPMHPQITSDQPGTCPICGMDLIPIEEYEKEFGSIGASESEEKKEDGQEITSNVKKYKKPNDRAKVRITLDRQQ